MSSHYDPTIPPRGGASARPDRRRRQRDVKASGPIVIRLCPSCGQPETTDVFGEGCCPARVAAWVLLVESAGSVDLARAA